jgi:hypothetical protein
MLPAHTGASAGARAFCRCLERGHGTVEITPASTQPSADARPPPRFPCAPASMWARVLTLRHAVRAKAARCELRRHVVSARRHSARGQLRAKPVPEVAFQSIDRSSAPRDLERAAQVRANVGCRGQLPPCRA